MFAIYMVAQKMKIVKEIFNAMLAMRTLYACCVRAVNTLQKLLARRRSVMDAIKTPCGRCVNAVWTL